MKSHSGVISLLAVAVLILTTAVSAAAGATSERVPFAQVAFVPCALGGAGELVLIDGTLHIVSHTRIDAKGGVHVSMHFQPQGAAGIGLTSGDIYRGTGVTRQNFNFTASGLPFEETFVNNFRIIGPGPGNNLLVHNTVHITINANGELTADVDNSSVECR